MKPRAPPQDELSLFQAHFDQMLNPAHPLVTLAGRIDWVSFETVFGETFCEQTGAPAKPTRLIVGLLYLKYIVRGLRRVGRIGRGSLGRDPVLAIFLRLHAHAAPMSDPSDDLDQVATAHGRDEAERIRPTRSF